MSNSTKPDWNVAIIDGQPQVVVNLAYVAKLINELPAHLRTAKLRRMRRHLDEQHFNELSDMVVGGRNRSMRETTTLPRINQEVDRWHLETYPQILAVVDRDGDVWTRDPDAADGDGWVWRNGYGHLSAPATAAQIAQFGTLRVAWVQR